VLYHITRKYAASFDRLHSEHRYVDTVACSVSRIFIRVDLRSVDIDRSGKVIGHYDTLVINSRPSTTMRIYIPVRRCARPNREREGGKKRKCYKLVAIVRFTYSGRIYTAAIVYSLERIVSCPAERKPAYWPQATFATLN